MEGAANQWIGLASVALFGAMVLSPFVFTWIYCDRPEAYWKRCLRATLASLVVIAASAALLLLFFQPHFPEGEVLAKVKDTALNGLIVAVVGPLLGADFLMRLKVAHKWRKSRGQHEV